MVPLFIAILVALGAGGTVVASDSARPGDILYPVDRAAERVRVAFTSDEDEAELKIKFANERIDEIESIVSEESEDDEDDDFDAGGAATSSPALEFSDDATDNLSRALDILTAHLAEIHGLASTTPGVAEAISQLELRLLGDADTLPAELRAKIRDDRGRVELRTEDGKIRVEVRKDGSLRVKSEIEDEDEDEDEDEFEDETEDEQEFEDEDEGDDDRRGANSGSGKVEDASGGGELEVEVEIETEDEDDREIEDEDDEDENEDEDSDSDDGEDDSDEDEDEDEDRDENDDSDDDDNSGSSDED